MVKKKVKIKIKSYLKGQNYISAVLHSGVVAVSSASPFLRYCVHVCVSWCDQNPVHIVKPLIKWYPSLIMHVTLCRPLIYGSTSRHTCYTHLWLGKLWPFKGHPSCRVRDERWKDREDEREREKRKAKGGWKSESSWQLSESGSLGYLQLCWHWESLPTLYQRHWTRNDFSTAVKILCLSKRLYSQMLSFNLKDWSAKISSKHSYKIYWDTVCLSSILSLLVFIVTAMWWTLEVLKDSPKLTPLTVWAQSIIIFSTVPSCAPIFLCSSAHHSMHPSYHLPSFHIIYSCIYLPIHISQDREFNITVPWGYSYEKVRHTDAIKSEKWSMSGGWMDCQHQASWPHTHHLPPTHNTLRKTHTRTYTTPTATSLLYHLDNTLKPIFSSVLTHLMAPAAEKW